jgi:prolyl 4-hydroxylase
VVDPASGKEMFIAERSSSGTHFRPGENDLIQKIEKRISEATGCPLENGESLQVLNYQIGGEYKPHFDYFAPEDEGSKIHVMRGGQRVSTLVIYLNDVEAGGATIFPEVGLSVIPKKGSAVYFEYCNSLNQLDRLSLHGGAPVLKGEKWIATKWVRQNKYG